MWFKVEIRHHPITNSLKARNILNTRLCLFHNVKPFNGGRIVGFLFYILAFDFLNKS